ncbi:MAG: asparagine synthase (glutamine-hydrolyzing) [Pseudomonadota bacterium]
MCGIAGLLAPQPDARPRPGAIDLLTSAMVHRGPDGAGSYEDGPIALGHRRLAIIDLSENGRQPMFNEDGGVVIVVNGEIYNHRELRRDLEARGHLFRSQSDSEIIAHLFEEEGARLPELLRGMFAFAVWDRRRQHLLLARDRYGEKPLYWTSGPHGLAFASEIAALLAYEELPATLDLASLDAYLALQYVPSPRTIFREIHKLPPGHLLEIECGGSPVVRPYYRTDYTPAPCLPEAEVLKQVRETVEESVRLRLMSDVPLGAFLSGGVDSSIVVACMAQASSQRVKTFSIGFPNAGDSELEYARLVARRWNTEHHEQIVSPDMVGVLPAIARHHGEPFGDPSAVPTYYLSQMTRRHVTVVLSGDAGDEAFGGYRRYVWAHVAHQIRRLPAPFVGMAARLLGLVPGGEARWLREYGRHLVVDEAARYLRFICHFSTAEKAALYAPELAACLAKHGDSDGHGVKGSTGARDEDQTVLRFAEILAASHAGDALGRLMDLDLHTYLPDDILTKVDIASMAHSLESRAPLVDHHVLGMAAGLPSNLKIRRLKGKLILKRAFADLIPKPILTRSKKGFSLPLARWFRGDLGKVAREALTDSRARARGLFRPEAVASLLDRHQAGESHGERLWNLLVLETWFRELVDGRASFAAEIRRRAEEHSAVHAADKRAGCCSATRRHGR